MWKDPQRSYLGSRQPMVHMLTILQAVLLMGGSTLLDPPAPTPQWQPLVQRIEQFTGTHSIIGDALSGSIYKTTLQMTSPVGGYGWLTGTLYTFSSSDWGTPPSGYTYSAGSLSSSL